MPVSNEGTGGSPITGFVIYVRREDEAVPSGCEPPSYTIPCEKSLQSSYMG